MNKTIIVDSQNHHVWNWNEKPTNQIPPAGIHPKPQAAMDAEAALRVTNQIGVIKFAELAS